MKRYYFSICILIVVALTMIGCRSMQQMSSKKNNVVQPNSNNTKSKPDERNNTKHSEVIRNRIIELIKKDLDQDGHQETVKLIKSVDYYSVLIQTDKGSTVWQSHFSSSDKPYYLGTIAVKDQPTQVIVAFMTEPEASLTDQYQISVKVYSYNRNKTSLLWEYQPSTDGWGGVHITRNTTQPEITFWSAVVGDGPNNEPETYPDPHRMLISIYKWQGNKYKLVTNHLAKRRYTVDGPPLFPVSQNPDSPMPFKSSNIDNM